MELGDRVGQKASTLVVPVFLGSDEGIKEFGFAVRVLHVEEIGLVLDPREPHRWSGKGSPDTGTAHTSTQCSSVNNGGELMFPSLGLI